MVKNIVSVVSKAPQYWSIGLCFTQSPTQLEVVEEPKGKDQISIGQLAELQAEKYLIVIDGAGAEQGEKANEMAAALNDANAKNESLQRELEKAQENEKQARQEAKEAQQALAKAKAEQTAKPAKK